MKILQLCKKFPYPLKDGESIAVTHLSRALNELGCEMTLLVMNTSKHYFDTTQLPSSFNHYKAIHSIDIDNHLKIKDAFLNLFSNDSYHVTRFISKEYNDKLIQLLQNNNYDVIQLETIYLSPYVDTIRKYSNAVISMRAHNVEHEIWERVTKNTAFLPKKWYLNHLTKKLRTYELEQLNKFDLFIPITQKDLSTFRSFGLNKKAVVTPIGLDSRDYHPNDRSYKRDLSLSFIGSLDWMPNIEGLKWFLEHIWGEISKVYPDLKLHIAGRNTPNWLMKLQRKNVIVHGEVNSAQKFINRHSVMIVPLHAGSGMRAKILEGMALGKVIITTSLGLEGIDANHRKEVLVADTAQEFIDSIGYCYKSNGSLIKMGKKALSLARKKYDNLASARELLGMYESFFIKEMEETHS